MVKIGLDLSIICVGIQKKEKRHHLLLWIAPHYAIAGLPPLPSSNISAVSSGSPE